MSLYYIFSIDGDWDEYFLLKRKDSERMPDKKTLLKLVKHQMRVASCIKGRFLHFVHTSPVARNFFLQPEFIALWKKIESAGGSVGVHCHEEDLFRDGYLQNPEKMRKSIDFMARGLSEKRLNIISYRGGYLSFCETNVPFLEKNGLYLDFSCDPDRYLWHKGELVSDWRGAPDNYYRMSYEDHRKPGKSKVFEIPLGKADNKALYIDITSLFGIWKAAKALARRDKEESGDIIVSVLSHTYEFSSFLKRIKIKLALLICKRYGTFINDRKAMEIITQNERSKT